MSFRDNLQHLRATRGMTQEQLAMLLGVSRQSVSKWEAERAYPEMDKLLQICDLFDCTLDELVTKDVTGRPTDVASRMASVKAPQDVTGYEQEMRAFAWKVALGAAIPILMTSMAFLLSDIAFLPGFDSTIFVSVIMFVGIAVGLAFMLPAIFSRRGFRKAHPFVEDFYTADQKDSARSVMVKNLVVGIVFVIAGMVATMVMLETPLLSVSIFFMFLALGVFLILYGCLFARRCNIVSYNQNSLYGLDDMQIDALDDEKLRTQARQAKRNKGIYTIIMLVATAVALVLMFIPIPALQRMFPVAWWVGILACIGTGVYRSSRSGD